MVTLTGFVNVVSKVYLDEKIIDKVSKSYFNSGTILRLDGFFNQIRYEILLNKLEELKGKPEKIADRFSYENLGNVNELRAIFLSDDFKKFLSAILGNRIVNMNFEVLRFGHRDYTLMHDSEKLVERVEWFMFFSDFWDENFGGQVVYSSFDVKGESLIFPVAGNSFILIKKRKDMGRFVKYINHLAGKESFSLVLGRIDSR